MSSARPRLSGFIVVFAVFLSVSSASAADWPPISPEEIKMTDIDQQKGAPAVILLHEELADDPNNYHSVYIRYSREFVRRNVLIQPDRTEDLRKLEGIIGADEVAAVVLKRAQ